MEESQPLSKKFVPERAIILYHQLTENRHYAEIHQISKGVFQEGRPLTFEELDAFKEMALDQQDSGLNQCYPYRNILGFNLGLSRKKLIWIHPAGQFPLLFAKHVKELKNGLYYLPNLVFVYDGDGVDVFAIKKKDVLNPGEKTKLYHAPFFNTGSRGDVCMGTAKIKKTNNLTELIHNVERAFFGSEFTHTNHDRIVKGNLIDVYYSATYNKKFDESVLIECIPLHKLFSL